MPTYSQAGKFGPAAISGAPAGAPLRVQDASGSDAVLYADASKNKTVGPIVQANDAGLVTFFADPGTYTVRWTGGSTTVTVSGGTADTPNAPLSTLYSANLLDIGEETFSRELLTSTSVAAASSQQMRLTYFTARKSETTTQVRVYSGGTAAGATPTLVRVGLYSVASNGDIALQASIANDTTVFAGVGAAYTRSWSSPYAKQAGQRYALGVLVVSGATMPTYAGNTLSLTVEQGNAPMLAATVSGQADLPASVSAGSITANTNRIYGAILP